MIIGILGSKHVADQKPDVCRMFFGLLAAIFPAPRLLAGSFKTPGKGKRRILAQRPGDEMLGGFIRVSHVIRPRRICRGHQKVPIGFRHIVVDEGLGRIVIVH